MKIIRARNAGPGGRRRTRKSAVALHWEPCTCKDFFCCLAVLSLSSLDSLGDRGINKHSQNVASDCCPFGLPWCSPERTNLGPSHCLNPCRSPKQLDAHNVHNSLLAFLTQLLDGDRLVATYLLLHMVCLKPSSKSSILTAFYNLEKWRLKYAGYALFSGMSSRYGCFGLQCNSLKSHPGPYCLGDESDSCVVN